jgi:uncharacterized tellurite resistance protein B-like protein
MEPRLLRSAPYGHHESNVMFLAKLLGLDSDAPARAHGDTEAVRKITQALDQMEPARARYIAAFAYILSRVAYADMNISPREVAEMERLVMEVGGLPEEQAIIVVQIAKTRNKLFGATENFLVTREFNEIATREDKLKLLECLFAVSASEDDISTIEDNEVSQISSELQLEHRDYIAVRYQFRDRLRVLRKPEEASE